MPTEGSTKLPFDAATSGKGLGPGAASRATPFYNPAMALNRDLSVLTVAAEAHARGRPLDVADVLCGAGARTLRIAREVPHPLVVHANDARPDAVAAVLAGAAANGVTDRVLVRQGDAFPFLAARRFDVVDIDPYGSPAPFIDAAVRATRHDGLLCVTATDTAALCGTYPRVARRRYDLTHDLHRHPWRAEVGLRGLIGFVARSAGRAERGVRVLWSLSSGHWMRVVVRVRDGATAADATWKGLGWAVPDDRGAASWSPRMPPAPERCAGPLWSGPLHDLDAVEALQGSVVQLAASGPMSTPTHRLTSLLSTMHLEAGGPQRRDIPAFWIDLDRFCGTRQRPTMATGDALAVLTEAGHVAAPSHLSAKGVRTDAPLDGLVRLLAP